MFQRNAPAEQLNNIGDEAYLIGGVVLARHQVEILNVQGSSQDNAKASSWARELGIRAAKRAWGS
jgi:hypothetical protein